MTTENVTRVYKTGKSQLTMSIPAEFARNNKIEEGKSYLWTKDKGDIVLLEMQDPKPKARGTR